MAASCHFRMGDACRTRNCSSGSHKLGWPIRPSRLPDELLSSWLNRAALAMFMSPAKLHLWIGDHADIRRPIVRVAPANGERIDENPHPKEIAAIAEGMRMPERDILAASLLPPSRGGADDLVGRTVEADPTDIRPSGQKNGKTQSPVWCCWQCVAEDTVPYFRRSWCLRSVGTCAMHGAPLTPICPRCCSHLSGKPWLYSEMDEGCCDLCGIDLGRRGRRFAVGREMERYRKASRTGFWSTEQADILLARIHAPWDIAHLTRCMICRHLIRRNYLRDIGRDEMTRLRLAAPIDDHGAVTQKEAILLRLRLGRSVWTDGPAPPADDGHPSDTAQPTSDYASSLAVPSRESR